MNKQIRCNGHHGSKSLFEGDCWTQYTICGNCRKPIDRNNAKCPYCGIKFDGVVNDDEMDNIK